MVNGAAAEAGGDSARPCRHRHHLVEIMDKVVVIIGKPSLVVGEHGEALFVLLQFTRLVRDVAEMRGDFM